jgi:hypothetical protein
MKRLIMQFSPTSRHFIPLLSTLFSNILSLSSSLNVRDQVSHPDRKTGTIIVLYILIFTVFARADAGTVGSNPNLCIDE